MGCCNSSQPSQDPEEDRFKTILERRVSDSDGKYKILLLGTGFSGKSTLVNQIRNIYGDSGEFTENEFKSHKKYIYEQIVTDMVSVIEFIDDMRTEQNFVDYVQIFFQPCDTCEYITHTIHSINLYATCLFVGHFNETKRDIPDIIIHLICKFIPEIVIYANIKQESIDCISQNKENVFETGLDKMLTTHIKKIWNEKRIKDLFAIRSVFRLYVNESSGYFWDNIDRFSDINKYTPTFDEILKLGKHTNGIIENNIKISHNVGVKVMQVGGVRKERKKWIHAFEDVTCVIFTASLSCYDEYLFEDETTNAMDEQINLFAEICNSRWFTETIMILLLTKNDLFREKIKNIPITVWSNEEYKFKEEYSDPNEYAQCLMFIKNTFQSQNKDENRQIYVHTLNILEKEVVEKVFKDVQMTIIDGMLSMAS